jgi:single-strand DNA-binding protein
MYVNKVLLVGNLTRDPELKSLPNGNKVCSISLATNRTYKDANGQKQESVEFHNVVAFGRTAENVAQYMKKGNSLYVEGRLATRNWEDKETKKKMYRTEIIAETIQFGSKGSGASTSSGNSSSTNSSAGQSDTQKFDDETGAPGASIDYGDTVNPEDIPF